MNSGWQGIQKKIRRRFFVRFMCRWMARAAVLILPLGLGIWLYLHSEKSASRSAVQEAVEAISPGNAKALLTLDDGKVIRLDTRSADTLKQQSGTCIAIDSALLSYHIVSAAGFASRRAQSTWHRVDIPHGGEYKLVLSDGTRVHLNSMSSLCYPVDFADRCREVELEGEGYFEVAKTGKPFIVKVRGMRVEVLGTTFNLSAYPDDEAYRTTLVEGSVKIVADDGKSLLLEPSQQVTLNMKDGTMQVRTVDISFCTSWVQGKINFKDQRLEDIMESLSRWYDMEVSYAGSSIRNLRFGCSLDRHESIAPMLQLLEKTEKVTVKVKGKSIEFCY